jgi:hypothetical protein
MIGQFVIHGKMLGSSIAVYFAIIARTFHVALVLFPKKVSSVGLSTQEPSGQVQELLKVAVGVKA